MSINSGDNATYSDNSNSSDKDKIEASGLKVNEASQSTKNKNRTTTSTSTSTSTSTATATIVSSKPACIHEIFNQTQISGDLICINCGQVLQTNSQLSTETTFVDRGQYPHFQSHTHSLLPLSPGLSYQDRSELSLKTLANQLITTYALKSSYSTEALDVMHHYWQNQDPSKSKSKSKYGHTGNRLLIATLFLLSRRDHLAINLSLLSASINATPQDCGVFFQTLTALNPGLKALASPSDFTDKALDLLLNELKTNFNICLVDSQLQLRSLSLKIKTLADLIHDTEHGASRSAESTALAASWLTLSSLLIPKLSLQSAVSNVCSSTTLSFKTVKSKYSQIVEKLADRAKELLPTTFTATLNHSKTQRLALLLDNLSLLIGLVS